MEQALKLIQELADKLVSDRPVGTFRQRIYMAWIYLFHPAYVRAGQGTFISALVDTALAQFRVKIQEHKSATCPCPQCTAARGGKPSPGPTIATIAVDPKSELGRKLLALAAASQGKPDNLDKLASELDALVERERAENAARKIARNRN